VCQGAWHEHGHRNTRQMGRLKDTKEMGEGIYPLQLRTLCWPEWSVKVQESWPDLAP
jgi:hypothetical protein